MIEPQKIQWKRLSAEAIAIVASILFAFAIDAWWDDRQQAGDEQLLLRSLLEDLTEKKVLLADDRTYNEAILGAVVGLFRAANDPTSELELEEDAIDRLIADTWWYNAESKWDSAPMTSLIGGDFSAVSNPFCCRNLPSCSYKWPGSEIFTGVTRTFITTRTHRFLLPRRSCLRL